MAVLRDKTANKSEEIPLFFSACNHQGPRVSAEDEISVADESGEKTGRPAARLQLGADAASFTGG
jgi:hypothetical protein